MDFIDVEFFLKDIVKFLRKNFICKIGIHRWEVRKCEKYCTVCSAKKDETHVWDVCYCTKCGETIDTKHSWDGCKCKKCGKVRDKDHSLNGCICSKCGKIYDFDHIYEDFKCINCGVTQKFYKITRYNEIEINEELDSLSIMACGLIISAAKKSNPITYKELSWQLKLPSIKSINSKSASTYFEGLMMCEGVVDFESNPFNPKIISNRGKGVFLMDFMNHLTSLNRDILYSILLKITRIDVAAKRPPLSLYVVDEDIILTPNPDKRFLVLLALDDLSVKYDHYNTANIIESYWKSKEVYLP